MRIKTFCFKTHVKPRQRTPSLQIDHSRFSAASDRRFEYCDSQIPKRKPFVFAVLCDCKHCEHRKLHTPISLEAAGEPKLRSVVLLGERVSGAFWAHQPIRTRSIGMVAEHHLNRERSLRRHLSRQTIKRLQNGDAFNEFQC